MSVYICVCVFAVAAEVVLIPMRDLADATQSRLSLFRLEGLTASTSSQHIGTSGHLSVDANYRVKSAALSLYVAGLSLGKASVGQPAMVCMCECMICVCTYT